MTGEPISEAAIREQHTEFERPRVAELEAALDQVARARNPVAVDVPTGDNTIRFGVCGDTQFGSLYECAEEFRAYCRLLADMGIRTVLHTGDVLDGHGIYRGQEFELHKVGLDAQLAWFAEVTADLDVDVHFVTGNHDASFASKVGLDIGAAIMARNARWHCLGRDTGRVILRAQNGRSYEVMLLHPGGGTAYALSYRPQKTVEQLEGGHKPQMLCMGHYHKSEFIPTYRNVAVIQSGCFQWQTPFMVRGSIAAHVGGWIIDATPGAEADLCNTVSARFVAFYAAEVAPC